MAAPGARALAIALVMSGGVQAALIGPELVKRTALLLPPLVFLGTYLVMALLPLASLVLLSVVDIPPLPPRRHNAAASLGAILARPSFITAVIAGLVAYGSMNLLMAATPLQMMLCGFTANDSTDVIRLHALAMFAPGFITGRLIQRFGVHRIIITGGLLTLGCAAFSLAAPLFLSFAVALMLLGVGWNFMFVGATTLLATAHAPEERVRAQVTNDFIIFGTVAITSFSSGVLHATVGWLAMNAALVPPLAIALGLVTWHYLRRTRPALAQ